VQNDDHTLRCAADSVFFFTQRFLSEPTERNRELLVQVMKHYTLQGLHIHLRRDAVIVHRQAQLTPDTTSLTPVEVTNA
jgi:hypothetical protein